jgi:hypothetical protein
VEPFQETIETLLPQIVRHCRLGDYGDAAGGLNKFVLALEAFRKSPGAAGVPRTLIDKLNYSLETVLLMLSGKDWVAVADILEYEMITIWREISQYKDVKKA